MNIYGMIYPQMAYSEIYYDTDVPIVYYKVDFP